MIKSKVTGIHKDGIPEIECMIKGNKRDIAVEFEAILRSLCSSDLLPLAIAVVDRLMITPPKDIVSSGIPVDDIDEFLEKLFNKGEER